MSHALIYSFGGCHSKQYSSNLVGSKYEGTELCTEHFNRTIISDCWHPGSCAFDVSLWCIRCEPLASLGRQSLLHLSPFPTVFVKLQQIAVRMQYTVSVCHCGSYSLKENSWLESDIVLLHLSMQLSFIFFLDNYKYNGHVPSIPAVKCLHCISAVRPHSSTRESFGAYPCKKYIRKKLYTPLMN